MKKTGDGRRIARVEQEIQKTIAQFLISGLKVRLPGLVTVARVLMPADLRTAKVYISVLGTDQEREEVLDLLQSHAHQVQNFIGRELRMRYCPRLTFYQDTTTEHVLKVDRILAELEKQKKSVVESDHNDNTDTEE
jgi:ribosome-binding factor A